MPKVPTITDLDRIQRAVVEYTPYDSPMFVNGPPGSGKTHIAILRLQVLLNNGYTNVLFLLYNHSMYGFLKSIFNSMGLSTNIRIETKDDYLSKLAGRMGYYSGWSDDYLTTYNAKLQHILNNRVTERFSVIVIDECQDFSDLEVRVLRRMSDKIIAVGDLDQKVYETVPSPYFRELESRKLNTIYRFGKKVARIAQPFSRSGESLESKVSTLNETDVFRVRATTDSDAVSKIIRIIKAKQFTNQTIAILAPTNYQLKAISSILSINKITYFIAEKNTAFRDYSFGSGIPVLITPFSAKGMEFDVVLLMGYNNSLNFGGISSKKKELLYVSLTRTSDELYLIDQPDTVPDLKNLAGWVDVDTAQKQGSIYDNGF
jgi:superfamily I DNA/RNA helicase